MFYPIVANVACMLMLLWLIVRLKVDKARLLIQILTNPTLIKEKFVRNGSKCPTDKAK